MYNDPRNEIPCPGLTPVALYALCTFTLSSVIAYFEDQLLEFDEFHN